MKIGILTFHSALNTGAVMQAYGLQQYLLTKGHQVEFIDYIPPQRALTWRSFVAKGLFKTLGKWEDIYYGYTLKGNFNKILKVADKRYVKLSELKKSPPAYDAYIAGSDQIWNFGFTKEINPVYLLDFGLEKIKRVAFSASMGQTKQPKEIEHIFKTLLAKFDAISVREKNGFDYLTKLLEDDKQIKHIADPTFLLSKDQFLRVASPVNVTNKFMISYILPHYEFPKELYMVVDVLKQKLDYELINLRNPNTCLRIPKTKNKVVSPQEWLGYMNQSEFNICCSFHAVVFSLIFHKPFVVVTPYKNQRIISLLEPLNLLSRCIYDFSEQVIDEIIASSVDWDLVDSFFIEERKKSIDFLQNALN